MAYALESDLDRTNVSVRELEKRLAGLEQAHNDTTDIQAGWFRSILSNLYDNPFPPATEAEWDDAHHVNFIIDRLASHTVNHPNIELASVEFGDGSQYHLRSHYRDEADCQCTCCTARKSQ